MLPAFLFEVKGGKDVRILGCFAETGSAAGEKDRSISFRKPKEGNPGSAGDYQANRENPAPGESRGDEAGYERGSYRADTYYLRTVRLRIHVRDSLSIPP